MKLKLLFIAVLISASVFGQNVPSYVPTNGLVGWWPFNGNANDESGNGNDGMVNGAMLTSDRFGNPNAAYDFDGLSNFIEVGDDSSLDVTNQYSISAWVYIPDYTPCPSQPNGTGNVDNFRTVVGKPRTSAWTTGYNLTTYPTGQTSKYYSAIQNQSCCPDAWVISQTVPQLNSWNNVCCVYDGISLSLYINGVLDSSIQAIYSLDNSSQPLFFGKEFVAVSNNWYRWFKGKIDDIGIWNRALSQQEITNILNSTTAGALNINLNPNFSVFPNPARDEFTMMVDQSLLGSDFLISDISGRIVQTGQINQYNTSFTIQTFASGTYFLCVGDKIRQTIKVVKD